MRFWDTSALVPLFMTERTTVMARHTLSEDRSVAVWWGTSVECEAAIARGSREGRFLGVPLEPMYADLARMRHDWIEVDATLPTRLVAERLVRTHPLRAADALQLAAAIAAAEGSPATLPFVTGDVRLAMAATLEGFPVIRLQAS